MVDTATFSKTIGDTVGSLAGSLVVFIIAIVIIGVIIGVIVFVSYKKKFNIEVMIYSQRADNTFSIFYDKGAILLDRKTKSKYFKLWEVKVELPVPPFNVMEKTNRGDLIRIWRKTNDEFIYITKPKIDRTQVLKQDGRYYQTGEEEYTQLEGDIAFWNLKRKQANRDLFSNDSIMGKIIAWMPQIIGGVFTVFILYILFQSMPALLNALTELAIKLNVQEAYQNVSR